ncbi:ammonium transporter [Anthocerotibacter panamensis]|uniref:ammonium transporter n=1 Tax=Anthocerotibacter panamensis TaxID=2857077 RepID=UPI001C407488|nr:ammonium transporter [Anthocerotibacter panamensis]
MRVLSKRSWQVVWLLTVLFVVGGTWAWAAHAAGDPTGGKGMVSDWSKVKQGPEMVKAITNLKVGLNMTWVLMTGFLVFVMQGGFAIVEAGFCRAKNAANIMMMNMMVFCVGVIGYFLCGFAFMFGGLGGTPTLGDTSQILNGMLTVGGFDLLGTKGFLLTGDFYDVSIFALFLFQLVFMDTAATIPTGATAERITWKAFLAMGLWVSMFIYPLIGCWVWGGGWLSDLGTKFGLGHGAVDFAGSGVVHMVGGAVGVAGAIALGPRIGKYNPDGTVNPIPGHSFPLVILGIVLLFFGWFGFNSGSTLAATDLRISVIAVNTMIAGGFAGAAAMFRMWIWESKPDPGYTCNGILAGLVAITAPCAFVEPWAAAVIGILAGGWVCDAGLFIERTLKIDDPCGAIAVHFCNGAWGLVAVGIFADGKYGDGFNGVTGNVKGFVAGDFTQIFAQLAECFTILIVVAGLSFIFFKILGLFTPLRVPASAELQGLDVPEMGIWGYPDPEATFSPTIFKTQPPPSMPPSSTTQRIRRQ